jgi:hypothetical protein
MNNKGEEIIFIISQPRCGSTLLQHIMASHSEIHTLPEPWLMIPFIYGLRSEGIKAEYNAQLSSHALRNFLNKIPNGRNLYNEAIRDASIKLYSQAIKGSGKKYFIDKTPRYYHIISELGEVFPKAHFIFLVRNPLAVLSSILKVSLGGNWRGLFKEDKMSDLLKAPILIMRGYRDLYERSTLIRYEDLVHYPEETVQKICSRLDLPFESEMIFYGDKIHFFDTSFVDRKSIYKNVSPVPKYVDDWKNTFETPQLAYIAREYMNSLSSELVEELGYSFDEIISEIKQPNFFSKLFLIPWDLLIQAEIERKLNQRMLIKFFVMLQEIQRQFQLT